MKIYEYTLYKIVKTNTEWYQVQYKRDFIFSFLVPWRIATNGNSNGLFTDEGFDECFWSEAEAMRYIDKHRKRFQRYTYEETKRIIQRQKINDYNASNQHTYKRSGL